MMFGTLRGGLRSYLYHFNRSENCGDWTLFSAGHRFMPVNQWTRLTQHFKINTPGQANGFVEFYFDGDLALRESNMEWRGNVSSNTARIDLATMRPFRGGGSEKWTVNDETKLQFSDFFVMDCKPDLSAGGPTTDPVCEGAVPPPNVTVTSSIANGAVLGPQPFTWTATVSPDSGPAFVEFRIDGVLVNSETNAIYGDRPTTDPIFPGWNDPSSYANGAHVFKVIDTDSGAFDEFSATIVGGNSSVAMNIEEGSLLGPNPFIWVATVDPDLAESEIEFSVDGVVVNTETNAPYGDRDTSPTGWNDPASYGEGPHTLTVTDTNTGESVTVNVVMSVPVGSTTLTVHVANVGPGAFPWTAAVSPANPSAVVEFFVDGVLVHTDSSAPYGDAPGAWNDTNSYAAGEHTLTTVETASGKQRSVNVTMLVDAGVVINEDCEDTLLAADWPGAINGGSTDLAAISGKCKSASGDFIRNLYDGEGGTFGPDTKMCATFSSNCGSCRMYLHLTDTGASTVDGYYVRIMRAGTPKLRHGKVVNGSHVILSEAPYTYGSGDVEVCSEVVGSQMCSQETDGSAPFCTTDTTHAGAGKTGVTVNGSETFDDCKVATLP